MPKVMTAFVRNKLINDVYLHAHRRQSGQADRGARGRRSAPT